MKQKLSKEQKVWCKKYRAATDFEPLIDDYLAGNESFTDAAHKSIDWFHDYCVDCQTLIPSVPDDE